MIIPGRHQSDLEGLGTLPGQHIAKSHLPEYLFPLISKPTQKPCIDLDEDSFGVESVIARERRLVQLAKLCVRLARCLASQHSKCASFNHIVAPLQTI